MWFLPIALIVFTLIIAMPPVPFSLHTICLVRQLAQR